MTFDDLPKINKAHINSADSVRAFNSLFCLPDFITREVAPDYGRDFDVELCESSSALNIVFSAQLKSVERVEKILGGKYVSFQIETGRLNYLTKTLCGSLLVIYDIKTQDCFYEWVHKLLADLDKNGSRWRAQEYVAVHISADNVLCPSSVRKIHSEVKNRYSSVRTALNSAGAISFMLPTPEAGDIQQELTKEQDGVLESLLVESRAWVSASKGKAVLSAYMSIPPVKWQNSSKHLLNLAYASQFTGMPLQALSYSNAAISLGNDGSLNEDDLCLAKSVRLSAKLTIGQLTSAEYYSQLKAMHGKYPESKFARQLELELILWDVVHEKDLPGVVDRLVEKARGVLNVVEKTHKEEDLNVWIAKRMVARVEFQAADRHIIRTGCQIRISEKSGYPMSIDVRLKMAELAISLKDAALVRYDELLRFAQSKDRADLVALCLVDIVFHKMMFLMISRSLQREDVRQNLDILYGSKEIQDCIAKIDSAISIYNKLDIPDRILNAMRLKAEILNMSGKGAEALDLLRAVREKGEILGISGANFQLTELPVMKTDGESDEMLLNVTDEELMSLANTYITGLNLPENRLENVYKDFLVMRIEKRERMFWCKHFEILQDLGHTKNKDTLYAINPDRHGKCAKLGHESKIGSADAQIVVEAFKSAYCVGCREREI